MGELNLLHGLCFQSHSGEKTIPPEPQCIQRQQFLPFFFFFVVFEKAMREGARG